MLAVSAFIRMYVKHMNHAYGGYIVEPVLPFGLEPRSHAWIESPYAVVNAFFFKNSVEPLPSPNEYIRIKQVN
jgi:hypothetical protein